MYASKLFILSLISIAISTPVFASDICKYNNIQAREKLLEISKQAFEHHKFYSPSETRYQSGSVVNWGLGIATYGAPHYYVKSTHNKFQRRLADGIEYFFETVVSNKNCITESQINDYHTWAFSEAADFGKKKKRNK